MKKIVLVLLIGIIAVSCKNEQEEALLKQYQKLRDSSLLYLDCATFSLKLDSASYKKAISQINDSMQPIPLIYHRDNQRSDSFYRIYESYKRKADSVYWILKEMY
jgi:uncharacterized protein YcfL